MICNKCGNDKFPDEMHWRKSRGGVRYASPVCRACESRSRMDRHAKAVAEERPTPRDPFFGDLDDRGYSWQIMPEITPLERFVNDHADCKGDTRFVQDVRRNKPREARAARTRREGLADQLYEVCAACSVRDECRRVTDQFERHLAPREWVGFRAGETPSERERRRKVRKSARRVPTRAA